MRTLTLLLCLVPTWALAQAVGAPVAGTSLVINNSAGDQTEPHVSGVKVAYTSQATRGVSEVRYHDLLTGVDLAIPNDGAYDSTPDVQGDQVIFTRAGTTNRIFTFDMSKGGGAQELAPRPDEDRRGASIGGSLVAFQESGYTARTTPPEIFVHRLDSLSLTKLTEDKSMDRAPAVSMDGQSVVWTKCVTSISGCDIWSARPVTGGYEVSQLTGLEGEESQPDTNGEIAVYVTQRVINGSTETDIAWQPVAGGAAQRLVLPGSDTHPNISGPLIAFEHWNASSATPNYDVVLYDLRTQTYYQLTDTSGSESLSDISMSSDGMVRVVWAVRQNGDLNVHAFVFRLPIDCPPPPFQEPADVCAKPGNRPLLGTLQVTRSTGELEVVSATFDGKGSGVLCVDNGYAGTRASAGEVWLGAGLAVASDEFGEDVAVLARTVPLQGRRLLSALVDGEAGSAFRVRLYGQLSCGGTSSSDASLIGAEMREGEWIAPEPEDAHLVGDEMSHTFVPEGYEGAVTP